MGRWRPSRGRGLPRLGLVGAAEAGATSCACGRAWRGFPALEMRSPPAALAPRRARPAVSSSRLGVSASAGNAAIPPEAVGSLQAAPVAAEAGEDAARDELRGEPLARDDDRQLVAAEPVRLLRRAEGARGDTGDLSEHVVAGRMTVGVVDALEIVQVEEDEAERLAFGVRQQLVESLLECAAVRQPGERVAAGLVVRERHAALVGHGGGRQIGDRCDEPVVELEPERRAGITARSTPTMSVPSSSGAATASSPGGRRQRARRGACAPPGRAVARESSRGRSPAPPSRRRRPRAPPPRRARARHREQRGTRRRRPRRSARRPPGPPARRLRARWPPC